MKIRLAYPHQSEGDIYYSLVVDGKRISRHEAYTTDGGLGFVHSSRAVNLLEKAKIHDLPPQIQWWTLRLGSLGRSITTEYDLRKSDSNAYKSYAQLKINFDWENWSNPWTIVEFCEVFMRNARGLRAHGIKAELEDHDLPSNGIELKTRYPAEAAELGAEIQHCKRAAEDTYRSTVLQLTAQSSGESLVTSFHFPDRHAAACKQYLIYFGEFLKLLDLEASISMSDEAKRVLFSVTPRDGKEALSAVRQALNIYLSLPQGKLSNINMSSDNVEIRGVANAVQHFKTTVTELEAADDKALSQSASFFGGRLLLKKLTHGPIELDLPRIISELREKFPLLKRL